MTDVKYAVVWAAAIVLLTSLVITLTYNWYPQLLPVHRALALPGRLMLRLFSEEMNFTPKIVILLSTQFVTYFLVVFAYRKIIRRFSQR